MSLLGLLGTQDANPCWSYIYSVQHIVLRSRELTTAVYRLPGVTIRNTMNSSNHSTLPEYAGCHGIPNFRGQLHMIQIPPNLPGLHRSCERKKTTAKIISRLPDFPDSFRHINTISLGLNFFTFHIIIPFLSYFPVDSVTFHLQATLFSIHLKP